MYIPQVIPNIRIRWLHLYQRGQNALYSQPARSPNNIAASISDSGKWWYAKPTPFTPEFSKFVEECIAAGYSEPNPQKWMVSATSGTLIDRIFKLGYFSRAGG